MDRRRLIVSAAVVLFGTTYLWFMPSFVGGSPEPTGGVWPLVQVAVLVTVVAFGLAGWALHRALTSWRRAALVAALLGATVPVLWWTAAASIAGVPYMVSNIVLHVLGAALMVAAVTVPGLRAAVDRGLHLAGPGVTAR